MPVLGVVCAGQSSDGGNSGPGDDSSHTTSGDYNNADYNYADYDYADNDSGLWGWIFGRRRSRKLMQTDVAADAIDKIRHIELCSKDTVKNHVDEHQITVRVSMGGQTITIEDTGLGMSKDDLINHLGVIAKSGTKSFMEALADSDKMSMIGQFGVGFYAAYLVADNVQVFSKRYDEDQCYKWESQAGGTFTVAECETDMVRGTRIVLYLKPDNLDYSDHNKLCQLVKKYNDFVEYPIIIEYEVEEEVPVEKEEEEDEDEEEDLEEIVAHDVEQEMTVEEINEEINEENKKGEKEEKDEKENEKEEKKEKEKVIVKKQEKANNQKPLWHKASADTTSDEYESLYKCLTSDWNTYLALKHFPVEGQLEFKSILFLPKTAPHDVFTKTKKQDNIKLYVKKVYITDDAEQLIPSYMSFITGVVDTNDLPLNISRELLQENKIVKQIKKAITKRVFEMINELGDNDFDTFYKNFSKNLKIGAYEDTTNRDKIMDILRFESTNDKEKMKSLSDYVSRMKEDQKTIYYITGESRAFVEESPFVKRMKSEVLFMTNPIDEYMMQQCRSYKDHTFVCITKVGADDTKIGEEEQGKFKLFCEAIHEIVGKNKLIKVQINKFDPILCA
eukprot:gene24568-10179_t